MCGGGRIQYRQTIILVVECLSNPCMNGATCNQTAGGYICICTHDSEGVYCESESTWIQNNTTVLYYNCYLLCQIII